ncbi:hypothetical protein FE257_011359 [Aspergillus nanangensis]|uniref:Peptidase A1 domain-containing protein n=1 Tax=Aspergillus nanangensis TaxID=2582783 RepID=A0AAD4GRI4_ASPNN|nr:hypothetical protein FE257_011359 [Aspergillus nanangensis]
MKSWHGLLGPVCFFLLWTTHHVQAASPFIVPWSDKSYGPNGPWRAVTIYVGSEKQQIDVFPGARWASTILTSSLCANTTLSETCSAEDAGVFDVDASTSAINATDAGGWTSWEWDVTGGAYFNYVSDTITLPGGPDVRNVSITAMQQAYQTYPDGENYPVSVGTLSLGAPATHFRQGRYAMNYITRAMYTSSSIPGENIPSYSYGMHIGSPALDIPGSLLLGGYDRNRVLGDVTSQAFVPDAGGRNGGALSIKLKDVSIGVDEGGSPFNFNSTTKPGLLAQGNSSMPSSGPEIEVNPLRPYIYLPQSSCDAITAELPVTYEDRLGLYLWNTSDERYARIVSSPSYLAFTFEKNTNNQQTLDIKVPFALLNLTLEDPLVDTPTPYFPLFPRDNTPLLGKAFLQAAFVGVNWGQGSGSGSWFLAQAPGPGLTSTPAMTSIDPAAGSIDGSASSWQHSWDGYLTPLPNGTDSAADGGDLSTGAKAGIGVGAGVGGIAILAALGWVFFLRRRRAAARKEMSVVTSPPYSPGIVSEVEAPSSMGQTVSSLGQPVSTWQDAEAKSVQKAPKTPVEVPGDQPAQGPHELG